MKRYNFHTNRKFVSLQPFARAIIVITAVAVLATGVTYAALQSQGVTLTGNTISTANADLRISTTTATSSTSFATTKAGFAFSNVVPGASATPADGNSFYLKNFGGAAMNLKLAINTIPTNTNNVDLNKVYIVLTRVDTQATQKLSIASLVTANATGGTPLTDNLAGGVAGQYKVQVAMDEDAFSGQVATLGGIDLVFNGTVVAAQ